MQNLPSRIRCLKKFNGPFDARELAAAGCSVLVAEYPEGTEIAMHTHSTDNCGVVTSGAVVLTVGGEERQYLPGDWYEIPAGVGHAARYQKATASIEFCFEVSA